MPSTSIQKKVIFEKYYQFSCVHLDDKNIVKWNETANTQKRNSREEREREEKKKNLVLLRCFVLLHESYTKTTYLNQLLSEKCRYKSGRRKSETTKKKIKISRKHFHSHFNEF